MSSADIATLAGAAVLLFWMVGAYNRLVRLRTVILRRFEPFDEQFKLRQGLLLEFCEALAPSLAETPQVLDALRAACMQADTAQARARARPGTQGATASLRLAEDILIETRARVPPALTAGTEFIDIASRLAASDATLAFSRRRFNDAVEEYNHAVRQFPTWLVASLFSFRAAGTL